jgi:hypothetical protein
MIWTLSFHFDFVTAQINSRTSKLNHVSARSLHGVLIEACCTAISILVPSYCAPNGRVCCSGFGHFGREWLVGWGPLDAMSGVDRQRRWLDRRLALAALMVSALALSGCASSIADLPGIGAPADAPERPKEQGAYLPVNNLPPNRDEQALDPNERAKIQAELIAARDRQAIATPPQSSQANSSQNSTQSQGSK